jgi:hypothetical protein
MKLRYRNDEIDVGTLEEKDWDIEKDYPSIFDSMRTEIGKDGVASALYKAGLTNDFTHLRHALRYVIRHCKDPSSLDYVSEETRALCEALGVSDNELRVQEESQIVRYKQSGTETSRLFSEYVQHARRMTQEAGCSIDPSTLIQLLDEGKWELAFAVHKLLGPSMLNEGLCKKALEHPASTKFFSSDFQIQFDGSREMTLMHLAKNGCPELQQVIRQQFDDFAKLERHPIEDMHSSGRGMPYISLGLFEEGVCLQEYCPSNLYHVISAHEFPEFPLPLQRRVFMLWDFYQMTHLLDKQRRNIRSVIDPQT